MQSYEARMEEAQRESDLRGSCPNIFRKIEQTGLRNTTHWNGSQKFNMQFDSSTTNSNNASSKNQQFQPPTNSFLKQQSPKNVNFYGSPVTHSIVVPDDN